MLRPLLQKYGPTRAALLVEAARPELRTRVVSAVEIFSDLDSPAPRFDPDLVRALMRYTHESTQTDNFLTAVDRRPARKQLTLAGMTLVLWIVATLANPTGMKNALGSLFTAWGDLRDVAQRMAGAKIVIEPLDRKAYLVGQDVTLRVREEGFHNPDMRIFFRAKGDIDWASAPLDVSENGTANYTVPAPQKTFECYFTAGRIQSDYLTVIVTERPRIASLTIEYELPEYVRRAPVVQPRSDGNLRSLYGSIIRVTIEANKELATVKLKGSFLEKEEAFQVAGRYAKGIIRLESDRWLNMTEAEIREQYSLALADEYGFTNDDADHAYELTIVKDQPPTVAFVGLPHRTSADEPHILAENLGSIGAILKGSDDNGISRITLHYRIEDLESGAEKQSQVKEQQFALPRAEIPQLAMLRLSDIGAGVGDRIVLWAEVEDAYNLDPATGPHTAKTPAYRFAVVTQEELFSEAVYRDDWSTQWYESLQVATLSKREIPARTSPESEPAADVAAKLLDASQTGEGVSGADQQLIQDYFDSLNVVRTGE